MRAAPLCAALVLVFGAATPGAHAESPPAAEATEVVVRALPARRSATEVRLSGARARLGAGTQDDALKAVQALPGFGRGGAGAALIAWGAPPSDTRILVDGVEIPILYHGSALRSVLPSELVSELAALPGAYDARFGRGVGGLVQIGTVSPDLVEPRFVVSADALDSSVLVSTPFKTGSSAALVAGRYGYVDRWLPELTKDRKLGESLYVVPSYWDAQGELALVSRDSVKRRLVLLASSDASERGVPSSDPARVRREHRTLRFQRLYLEERRTLGDGSETLLVPYIGWDSSSLRASAGSSDTSLDTSAFRYGLRASLRTRLSDALVLEVGSDVSGLGASVDRDGSLAVPRREGDPWPFGTAPAGTLTGDAFSAHELAAGTYAQAEAQIGQLVVTPAVRVELTLIEASRSRVSQSGVPDVGVSSFGALVEPRLAARLRLSKRVELFFASGRYHQLPSPEDLGAVAGNPELGPASSTHWVLGEDVTFSPSVRLSVRGFARFTTQITTRNLDPFPPSGRALVDDGRARAYGSELFLRVRSQSAWQASLALALARSEVQTDTPLAAQSSSSAEPRYRLSDWDSPLFLAATLEKGVGAYRFATRLRFASGNPRTPITGTIHETTLGNDVPLFGPTNTERLPSTFALDLRVDRAFRLGEASTLNVYLDVTNLSFERNAEDVAYNSDFTRRAYVRSLPPLAMCGLRLVL